MSAPNFSNLDHDWSAYRDADNRLAARIAAPYADDSPVAIRERARRRLDHLKAFLAELDHPERRVRVVHVTGTSGKGSTAAGIAALLTAAGLKTGLATSPYLQVATEKLQIDGRLVSGPSLRSLLAETETAERHMLDRNAAALPLTYGELWPAIALRWFDREAVDIAVVEVGAGGRLDPTNVVHPVASVITGIGLDHVATLGPTLTDIAWHKAGIIKPGAPVIVGPLPAEAWPIVDQQATAAGVRIERVSGGIASAAPLPEASFVAANKRIALATLRALADDGIVDPSRIDPVALDHGRLPGRLETMPQPPAEPVVVLDGAHNPQKMAALTDALHVNTRACGPRPVVVFGALAGKATAEMISMLARSASALVTTSASVPGKSAADPVALAEMVRAIGFAGPVLTHPDPEMALDRALALAAANGTWVLVTGSLFLLGALRGRWYPADAIVRQRTPWPAPPIGEESAGWQPIATPTGPGVGLP